MMGDFVFFKIINISMQLIDLSFLNSDSIDKCKDFRIFLTQLSFKLFCESFLFIFAIADSVRELANGMSVGDDSGFRRECFFGISRDKSPSLTGIERVHKEARE
jgi:hypothetical protein